MMRPLIRVTLFNATSENDCTLLEEDGEYFVDFGNRTGTYREFLRMILRDDRLYPDLVAGLTGFMWFMLIRGPGVLRELPALLGVSRSPDE